MEETGLSESKGESQMIRKPKQMSESMILGVVLMTPVLNKVVRLKSRIWRASSGMCPEGRLAWPTSGRSTAGC